MEVVGLIALSAIIVGLGAWWLVMQLKPPRLAELGAAAELPVEPERPTLPATLFVVDGDRELMSLTAIDETAFSMLTHGACKLNLGTLGHALEPIMQLAPSMATAALAGSRQLMEVVVKGDLMAAADGNGLRAIVSGPDGIKEHARLFEPNKLKKVANFTVIWQLASVMVAQKHLADLSATLQRVEAKIDGIQRHMERERLAIIKSVMNYLSSARNALEKGEFLERTRGKLEQFDTDLERASISLAGQIEQDAEGELEHDTVGCEGEYKSALEKHRRLNKPVQELGLCNEVRLANWYLCSLYRDQSKLLDNRLEQIQAQTRTAERIKERLQQAMLDDCRAIKASFTLDDIIKKRKREVREVCLSSISSLQESIGRCETIFARLEAVAVDYQTTNRLIISSENGEPAAVYLCQEQSVESSFTKEPVEPMV